MQRYIVRTEILPILHTRVDNRSIRHFGIVFTPKLSLPLRRSPPKSNTPHSPPQTASGSNQRCCHCSHLRTDRWLGRMFRTNSAPLSVLIESAALIIPNKQYLNNMKTADLTNFCIIGISVLLAFSSQMGSIIMCIISMLYCFL